MQFVLSLSDALPMGKKLVLLGAVLAEVLTPPPEVLTTDLF